MPPVLQGRILFMTLDLPRAAEHVWHTYLAGAGRRSRRSFSQGEAAHSTSEACKALEGRSAVTHGIISVCDTAASAQVSTPIPRHVSWGQRCSVAPLPVIRPCVMRFIAYRGSFYSAARKPPGKWRASSILAKGAKMVSMTFFGRSIIAS